MQQTKQVNNYATATAEAGAGIGDFIGSYHMDEHKSNLAKANYYLVLVDGSTEKVIVEQEPIYILFLNHGMPKLNTWMLKTLILQTLGEFSKAWE